MGIIYIGETAFTLQSREESGQWFGIDSVTEVWKGAEPNYNAFYNSKNPGSGHEGGYILERRGNNSGMYPEITLRIALAPDFGERYTSSNSTSVNTASKGGSVETDNVIEGATEVSCDRQLTFQSPQTTYNYFSSRRPSGPRFKTVSAGMDVIVMRDITTVTGSSEEGGSKTLYFFGSVPSPLISATSLNLGNRVISHNSEPIPGTPWYSCSDVVAYGFWE